MKRDKIASMGCGPTGVAGARTAIRGVWAVACAGLASPVLASPVLAAGSVPVELERTLEWAAISNGGFEERGASTSPPRIPWWRSTRGIEQIETGADGASRLRTGPGEHAEQPFVAFAPLVSGLVIRGSVIGTGVVTVVDGSGASARFPVGAADDTPHEFAIHAALLERELKHPPTPRFLVRLEGDGEATARWDDVSATVQLPCPDEAALRAEIVGVLDTIFADWEERALDVAGPRKTAFIARSFDVVTGAELGAVDPAWAFFPLQENLFDATIGHDSPRWSAFLARYLEDIFSLALHPDTGLPCLWNATTDQRIDDRPLEIGLAFGFLIDVAREGPEPFRARARAAAVRIGETVLAHGVLPDGEVAASYLPRTGAVNLNVNRLRRLDVPCQLARLAVLTGDERFARPAREALATLEFAHHWAGKWDEIDPAFDDDFGHYGARSATIARASGSELPFHRFAVEGMRHFLGPWRDATRFGGNLAADQVRCWRIAADLVRIEPELRPELEAAVHAAIRAHVQGEQYGNGAWGDVTIFDYSPRTAVQVGDMPGTPQNLLNGLAAAYGADLGATNDTTRALYTAVLRSTIAEYGRPHGFLLGRRERANGGNRADGSLRILLGLTTMLRALAGKSELR